MPRPSSIPFDKLTVYQKAIVGLNPRQVAYCRLRFQGVNQKDAYIQAGYKQGKSTTTAAAISLMENNPKIIKAIANLQEIANNRAGVTREQLIDFLLVHREEALVDRQIGAANAAVMGIADIMGLKVSKSEVNITHKYEADEATRELYNMLSRRGKLAAPDVVEGQVIDNDTE